MTAGLTPDQVQALQSQTDPLIDNVSFNIDLSPSDIAPNKQFPPGRFSDRDARLERLRRLWQGDFADELHLPGNQVIPNLFSRYSVKLANLLLMSPPTGAPPEIPLGDVLYDALIDMSRYGAAILYHGEELDVVDPTGWYPTRPGGHYLTRTYVSDQADSPRPDRFEAIHVDPDGNETSATYQWDMGQLGNQVAADDEELDAQVLIIPRDPRNGIWGTSKYLELWSSAIEIGRRLSKNSRILDMFTAPIPAFRESQFDAEQRFAIPQDDPADDKRQQIAEGYLGMILDEVVHLPADILDMFFVQPDTGGVKNSLEQVSTLLDDHRDASGLPNFQGQTLSGEALKRLFVFFYAETKQILESLRTGAGRLLGTDLVWEHIFDTDLIFDTSANQQ